MSNETTLLNVAFSNRGAYEFLTRMDIKKDLSPSGDIIWQKIEQFYGNDHEAVGCDMTVILSRLEREFPKHAELLMGVMGGFSDELSIPNLVQEVKDYKQEAISNKLASLLVGGDKNKTDDIQELMDDYTAIQDATNEALAGDDAKVHFGAHPDDFIDSVLGDDLIQLFPRAVNERVGGGVPRGTHILVYARPEAGKSLFSINFTYGFCKQGLRTLYIGNEDPATVMWNRFLTRFSGLDKFRVYKDREHAFVKAKENGYANLAFVHMSPGSVRDIEHILKEHGPFDCLVVDQLRNLRAVNQSKVEGLEEVAMGIRGLAQRYDLVAISVTQAGDSGEGKLELGMGDVDFSNTGIPAQVDVMIGIGVNTEYDRSNHRMVSFPKNKLSGDHQAVLVAVQPTLSRVTSQ